MRSPVIEIQGLAKSYRGVPAVRDVSLTVDEGEIFALLGPNGAGKTTTSEPGGSWQTGTTAIVMVIWCAVGLAITKRTFTWMSERKR